MLTDISGFPALSVWWDSVWFMGQIMDLEAATGVAGSVCSGLDALRGSAFWKLGDKELLTLAGVFERVGRLVYAAQVHLTGELDTRRAWQQHSATSTAALLRHTLYISPGDAAARVRAARAILPRDLPTGGQTPPELPELAAAVDAGTVGVEQTRTVVSTMRALPAGVNPEVRAMAGASLAANAQVTEPVVFARFARQVAQACDPDGTLDERDPVDKVELSLGSRNTSTGLTGFKGFLDDLGVELLSTAIDGLAAPRPSVDGTADPRPAKVRRGQALIEVLRRFLDVGFAPTQGGERPHVTVTMDLDALHGALGTAMLDHGGPITAAHARMLACDAMIIPAVLGSRLPGPGHGDRGPVVPQRHPPGHHPAGPRMHVPRLRPARHLVRLPPRAALGGRRPDQPRERGAALPAPSPRDSPRPLGHPFRRRRHPRIPATTMDRPEPHPPPEHHAPPTLPPADVTDHVGAGGMASHFGSRPGFAAVVRAERHSSRGVDLAALIPRSMERATTARAEGGLPLLLAGGVQMVDGVPGRTDRLL